MIVIAKPSFSEAESIAVQEVLQSCWPTQGPRVAQFEKNFADYVGSPYACAVSSCTTALHLALLAACVKPGNLVIKVSHSFIATANAIRHAHAEPLFVDIEEESYNISPIKLRTLLTKECEVRANGSLYFKKAPEILKHQMVHSSEYGRVAALLLVHQMGIPCHLEACLDLAKSFHLPVIEDAACAIGSERKISGQWSKIGAPVGDIACFSFHPRKIITTGDGGMLTTRSKKYDDLFRLLRQHGMSTPDTARHSAKKVTIENYMLTGFNYRMTDLQAALGIEQLRKLPLFLQKRRELAQAYQQALHQVSWIKVYDEPKDEVRVNWQSYPVRILSNAPCSRDQIMQHLLDHEVASRPGIMNAHNEAPYEAQALLAKETNSLRVSEESRATVLLLPMHQDLTLENIHYIAKLLSSLQRKDTEE